MSLVIFVYSPLPLLDMFRSITNFADIISQIHYLMWSPDFICRSRQQICATESWSRLLPSSVIGE
ncbi:hypothetical protein BC936DRAFT_139950 [Jimgerdemannia flammicorona]|uniref:Uncharacterized protein n=1 Tax=Jimgerdemannia flammicorona TaxID=994334 RepID=A0A433B8N5_9FUNG|nr:hypothetical protein BC936DRAFT_139950 [Jimgerdemannia flammicorona]